jgi:hypothetical protein
MDITLLWVALGLIVIGAILCIIGERMKPREALEPPSWDVIIRTALGYLLTGIGQIVNGPSNGHRVQGLGSAVAIIGFFVALAWVVGVLLPKTPETPTPSASPVAS